MEETTQDILQVLRRLLGKWQGSGVAQFPTIPTFEHREEIAFEANAVQPLLHFDQRTWKKAETGEFVPSHWETGFLRVLPSSEIELLCAQSGGRVEIARGPLRSTSTGFRLHLMSVLIENDARMEKTTREFLLDGNTLRYSLAMSTAVVPQQTQHIHAELIRKSENKE